MLFGPSDTYDTPPLGTFCKTLTADKQISSLVNSSFLRS